MYRGAFTVVLIACLLCKQTRQDNHMYTAENGTRYHCKLCCEAPTPNCFNKQCYDYCEWWKKHGKYEQKTTVSPETGLNGKSTNAEANLVTRGHSSKEKTLLIIPIVFSAIFVVIFIAVIGTCVHCKRFQHVREKWSSRLQCLGCSGDITDYQGTLKPVRQSETTQPFLPPSSDVSTGENSNDDSSDIDGVIQQSRSDPADCIRFSKSDKRRDVGSQEASRDGNGIPGSHTSSMLVVDETETSTQSEITVHRAVSVDMSSEGNLGCCQKEGSDLSYRDSVAESGQNSEKRSASCETSDSDKVGQISENGTLATKPQQDLSQSLDTGSGRQSESGKLSKLKGSDARTSVITPGAASQSSGISHDRVNRKNNKCGKVYQNVDTKHRTACDSQYDTRPADKASEQVDTENSVALNPQWSETEENQLLDKPTFQIFPSSPGSGEKNNKGDKTAMGQASNLPSVHMIDGRESHPDNIQQFPSRDNDSGCGSVLPQGAEGGMSPLSEFQQWNRRHLAGMGMPAVTDRKDFEYNRVDQYIPQSMGGNMSDLAERESLKHPVKETGTPGNRPDKLEATHSLDNSEGETGLKEPGTTVSQYEDSIVALSNLAVVGSDHGDDVLSLERPMHEEDQEINTEVKQPGAVPRSQQANRRIYDQLKKIDWVMGYYSSGESIEVYVNLGSLDPHVVEQQLADITGADISKFHAKQNEKPVYDYDV